MSVNLAEDLKQQGPLTQSMLWHFAMTSLAWLAISAGLCWISNQGASNAAEMKWLFGLWLLSVVDLLAIAKTVSALLGLSSASETDKTSLPAEPIDGTDRKRAVSLIQASTWGTVKLACIGLFIAVLIQAESVPTVSLIAGLGTLVVVPLVGGLLWGQRTLRHA